MQEYVKVDQQLHLLSQLIAKINRTYIPAKEDDSHTNLFYDNLSKRITGRWIQTEKDSFLPTININHQSFECLNSSNIVAFKVGIVSKSLDEIENEIECKLPSIGLDPSGFTEKLHFDISPYDFSNQTFEVFDPTGIQLWKEYRALANEACFFLLGHAQVWEEIRIWPHHFDTGIYFKSPKKTGIGFGLAMKDDMAGAPYFYMSAYPENGKIEYKNLPKGEWKWIVNDQWKGAILTLKEIENDTSLARRDSISKYLKNIYHWMISQ